MGELGEELGRVLKVLLVNLWKHLDGYGCGASPKS
jgi:hypothetical protein